MIIDIDVHENRDIAEEMTVKLFGSASRVEMRTKEMPCFLFPLMNC